MAKSLNQFDLKDAGGTGKAGQAVNTNNRKKNLPDLTTSFANALTQGVNSLAQKAASVPTDNSATKSLVGSKASPVIQNDARKQQNTTAKAVVNNVSTGVKKNLESLDQKLGDTTSVAMSSLAGTTTPNQNRELYDYQNRHGGNIVTSTRAKREAEKAGTWDYLSWLNEKAGEVPNVATASLVGSNASPETIQAAQEQQNRPVTQLTEWATGNEFADALINLDEKAEAHRNKSEQLQQEAYDKYGQYETEGERYVDEIFSSAGANALRWGKRAALMALGVPMELLNATTDASMFMSAAGDAVREAEEMGSSDTATAIHALISGAAEAGFEHLTDPFNIVGYSFGVGDAVDNAIKKSALKPAMKFLLTLGAHAKLEGVEELFTEAVQGLSRKYALGQNISGKEIALNALKADLAGTLSSFLLMGLGGDTDYTQYKEDLAMYYWNMSEEQKTDVAELLGNAFGKDPALIRRSMDDRAFDQIEQMDGQTLMRAVNNAPVFIDPRTGTSIYEVTKYTEDQQKAKDFADRLGVKMNPVEDIESVAGDNGKQYIADGFVTPDDTILISAASPTPIQDTLFHEVVHSASNTPEGQEFINFAQEAELAERGAEGYREYYDGVADAYRNVYDPNSQKFASQVGEEIAAKFTKRLAADPDTMERIYRRNGNMFQRIYQGIRDAVATFDNTENLTDEQKTLLKTEKLYSNMLKRMRRDAILDGMGLGEGDVINSQTIGENIKEIVNRGKRGEPMTNASQVAFSLAMNDQMMQKAKEVNRESKFVAEDVMEIAEQQRLAVQQLMMQPKVLAVLPADDTTTNGKANTKMKNGSYGISEENTTVCVRMMSNEYVLDRIAERIGRPLNVSESLKISQMFMQWAAKAQCLYCYEGMDRWAKREFHNRWFDARDYVVGRLQGGADYNEVYDEYLDKFLGRKPGQRNGATDKRMQMWQRIANGDIEAMPRAALASVDARDKAWAEHPEWREQLRNADGYAQSASYAKKNIAYTAYDGHILKWSDNFIKQLNSDFGMRMYSFSDFSKAFILENMQMVTDAAVKGLKGLSYTKEADFVKIFAPSGMLINCSIFGMNGQNGVERDEMQGMKWDEAKALRDKYPNVGIIFVATNDQQVEWGLDQDWIDVVIPFHTVKTGEQIAAALNFTNYKGMQEDRKLPGWDKTKHVKSISPAMHNNDLQTYLRLCEENHLSPRFPEWMNHPNYMKLVVETRMPYNEAQPLQPVFDTSEVESMLNDFVRRGGFENEGYGSVKIPLTEVSNRLADAFVRDGGASYTAGNRIGQARYSLSNNWDNRYFDALNRGDMEEAQRLVEDRGNTMGYNRHSYHGTMNGGFTQFDRRYANPEGNSGAGFYSTTDYDDANDHYRNVEGADNFFKRSTLADQIFESGEWNGELVDNYDDAYQIATDELNKNPQLYELRFRSQNPYTRNFYLSDQIDLYDDARELAESEIDRDDYDSEDDYEDDLNVRTGEAVWETVDRAVYDALADIEDHYEILDDLSPDRIRGLIDSLAETAIDNGNLNWNSIQQEVFDFAEDYTAVGDSNEPDYLGGELTRAIIENLGYDAIIDKEVDRKFNQVQAMPGTEHYIAFSPGQYKLNDTVTYDDEGNVIPLSQRFDVNNPDMRYSLNDMGEPLTEGQQRYFANSVVRNADGNLKVMYHGSDIAFNEFDKNRIREVDYDAPFNGFWFSDDKNTSPAMHDATVTRPFYLNITNPAPADIYYAVNRQISEDYRQATRNAFDEDGLSGTDVHDRLKEELQKLGWHENSRSYNDELRYRLQDMGYDGIHWGGIPDVNWDELYTTGLTTYKGLRGETRQLELYSHSPYDSWLAEYAPEGFNINYADGDNISGYESREDFEGMQEDVWVAFEPSQIKSVDNADPTNSNDIRYSLDVGDNHLYQYNSFMGDDIRPFIDGMMDMPQEGDDVNEWLTNNETQVKKNLKKLVDKSFRDIEKINLKNVKGSKAKIVNALYEAGRGGRELDIHTLRTILEQNPVTATQEMYPGESTARRRVNAASAFTEALMKNLGFDGFYDSEHDRVMARDSVGSPKAVSLEDYRDMVERGENLEERTQRIDREDADQEYTDEDIQRQIIEDSMNLNAETPQQRDETVQRLAEAMQTEPVVDDIPEQANAFPDRNYPQDRSAMRTLGQISRERVAADPLTYESITPESFPVPDRIQDYLDLIEDEEDRKYGFDEAPEKELSEEDKDMYQSIQGNKSGALQGFATPTQMFNNMVGKTGEQREFLRDRYERPMYETKKEYNANREQRWTALENMMKETGIQANTPESAAVQWYGEKVKPNEQGETVPYTLNDLKREFPDKWEDIVKMEQFMRGMYDEYVGRINAALEQVYPNLEEKAQAQLESWRNKIRVYQDEIEMSRNPVANEYWQNEIAKLDKKIAKLEGDLESGEYFRNKRLNPRQDYFHHFQEVETKGIGGLKNILQASTLIDPQLVGKTEFTKPKSRWMNWLQKRGQGAYTADAVLGMGRYIDSAEYAIAFDPLIAQYRDEISNMVKATRDTKNANQLIQYLSSYTNQLAGKTASLDRTILDLLGEGNRGQLFNALAAINNRAKSNAVVGNVRSAIAQFFNIPNAMSIIKSNSAWAKGVRDYANAKLGNRELLDQSPFLQERYFDHNVDDLKARNTDWEKITGKLGDITNEMMTFGDREATELIWLAAYNEGIENGVSDPTYYADDLTRQSVAGRGIGEVPYNMKSKVASFFMPFQVETNNQWQNLKGMLKDKDAKGVFRLMLGAYLMNAMVKPLFNDGVLPDIIDVLVQGLRKLFDKDREESVGEIALDTGKRMAGEAVSFIPGTSLWLPAIMSSDSAEALFGDSDPTRYGTGTVGLSTITKTLADALDGDGQFDLMTPLLQLGLPYGGKQASRLYNTLQDMNILPSNGVMNTPFGGEKNPISGDYSKAGALKYQLPEEVDSFGDAAEIARAFLFGSNATNAAQEYFDTLKPVLNKTQVEKLKENPEVDPQTYIDYVHQANVDGKNGISQAEAYDWLSKQDLSDEERNALWSMTNSAWNKTYDEYTPQNETIVENADTNGDGRVTQAEAYSWLSRQDDISDEEKNAMWDENGWSTSYDKYDKAHKGVLGYNRGTLVKAVDTDGNGQMKQTELYTWLQNQGYTEQEKSDLWDLAGWKTDYQAYVDKMNSKKTETKTETGKVKSMDELMGKEAPKSPSGITNRKELLIAADSNNDGYMSQKEAYTYLSNTDLSEEEKEALWNLSNWKTSYQKYKQKNG